MCDEDATIRDLRWSLERAQERLAQQAMEIINLTAELQEHKALTQRMSGIVKTLSMSMGMGAQREIIDESKWGEVAKYLARKLALRDSANENDLEYQISQQIGIAIAETTPLPTDTDQVE